jgi:hypothetical protein
MEFESADGVEHGLESTTDIAVPTSWAPTGGPSILGDGGTLIWYDPTGSDAFRAYRITTDDI